METKTEMGNREGIVFVGNKKPFMNYVAAVLMELSKSKEKEIKVIARGNAIRKAADVLRIVLSKDSQIKITETIISGKKVEKKDEKGNKYTREISNFEVVLKKA